jgi:dihydrolipoamide dehydrogenase
MMKYKEKAVEGLTKGVESLFRKNNVEFIKGHGILTSPQEITVEMNDGSKRKIRTKHIIVATGSEAIPFPGLEVRKLHRVCIVVLA